MTAKRQTKGKKMKLFVIHRLEELDSNVPETEIGGVFLTEIGANEALADWILELAKKDSDFARDLAEDENHEDLDPTAKGIPTREYILSEIVSTGGYTVYANTNLYKFDITETFLTEK